MNRALSLCYWLVVGLVAIAMFPVALLLWVVTRPFDRRGVVLHRFTNLWALIYVSINPWWSLRVRGREHIDPDATYVMVSNHQSLVDVFALHGLRRHFKWVSKEENFRIPCIGWNMRLNDYVPLSRGSGRSVREMFERCQRALRQGSSVLMFPEGTRSRTGRLRRFRPGAFELAQQAGVAVLPIVVQGSFHALRPHSLNIGRARIRVTVLRAISADEVEALSTEELMALTRARIAEHVQRWPWPPQVPIG